MEGEISVQKGAGTAEGKLHLIGALFNSHINKKGQVEWHRILARQVALLEVQMLFQM